MLDTILNILLYFVVTPAVVLAATVYPVQGFFWIVRQIYPYGINRRDKYGFAMY